MEISKDIFGWDGSRDHHQFMVFCYLAVMAEEYKVSYTLRSIAEALNISHMTVKRILGKLEKDGIIVQDVTRNVTYATIYRYVTYPNKKKKGVTKCVTAEIDLTSFVAVEHLDKWKEWLDYRSSIRKKFASTATAKKNYELLVAKSTITITDHMGISTKVVDNNKLNAIIDYTIANQYQGLIEPKNYGYSSYNNNTGRTTQQDAERNATEQAINAAQSTFDAERRKAELRASIGIFG